MSAEVNQAILIAFRSGWINSSSLMTNMPGFDEACALIESENLKGQIGVHLNLSEGRPLTCRIASCSRFCDEHGMFHNRSASARHAALYLAPIERLAVREELEAQIRACSKRGLRPSHLDSHRHHHTEWAIGSIVLDLAGQEEIAAIRIMRNCKPLGSVAKRFYRTIFNSRLRRTGLARSRYFGNINEIRPILSSCQEVEIMVHPRLSNSVVVDFEQNLPGQALKDLQQTAASQIRLHPAS